MHKPVAVQLTSNGGFNFIKPEHLNKTLLAYADGITFAIPTSEFTRLGCENSELWGETSDELDEPAYLWYFVPNEVTELKLVPIEALDYDSIKPLLKADYREVTNPNYKFTRADFVSYLAEDEESVGLVEPVQGLRGYTLERVRVPIFTQNPEGWERPSEAK